jgi:hypothetical protein
MRAASTVHPPHTHTHTCSKQERENKQKKKSGEWKRSETKKNGEGLPVLKILRGGLANSDNAFLVNQREGYRNR